MSRSDKERGRGSYCSLACRPQVQVVPGRAEEGRRRASRVRRARKRGAIIESFNSAEIYERDGWICGICKDPVDPEAMWPDQMSASLDHIIPLAKGGAHSRENVQCSHWLCNSRKTDLRHEREIGVS